MQVLLRMRSTTSAKAFFVVTHDRRVESRMIHDRYGSIAAFITAHGYGPDRPNGDGPRATAPPR